MYVYDILAGSNYFVEDICNRDEIIHVMNSAGLQMDFR